MSIQRDYSQSFFSDRRRGPNIWMIFIIGLLIGGFLVMATLRRDQMRGTMLSAMGIAPTATPFASDYATWGLERYQEGDVAGAVKLLEEAVRLRPEDVDYLYEYGVLLIENDQINEAVVVGEQAIALAPGDPRGYALKGRGLMWTDPEAAIQVSLLGLDVDADFAPLYAVQGVAYTNQQRLDEGVRQTRRAIELAPNDPFVLRASFSPLIYWGLYEDAVIYLEQAIISNPNLTAPFFELAALYKHPLVNQPEMALALYDRILEIEPDNAKAYLRICQTYANVPEARFEVAQPYCDRAIGIDPEYGDAYLERGRMQYLRRNYEGAIKSFEACLDHGSTGIECWYLRGLAHYRLGNCDEAWTVLQESLMVGQEQSASETVMTSISDGLVLIILNCPGYSDRLAPTAPAPTPPPATPIGGY